MRIERCRSTGQAGWLPLREALWPECPREQHVAEMRAFLVDPRRHAQFVAHDGTGEPVGLAEVSLRTDHMNGTTCSPVGFLEGIYVAPAARRRGIARGLLERAERWAREVGGREFASDAALGNLASHAWHQAVGFVEGERVVFFRKPLD